MTDATEILMLQQGLQAVDNDVHSTSDSILREVSTDTQFLNNGQRHIVDVVDRGFIGAARDAAATDRNVDAAARHLDHEVRGGLRGVEHGIVGAERHLDDGLRWLNHENREHERHEYGEFRGLERGQRHVDDRMSDGFYRAEKSIGHVLSEASEKFGRVNDHLSNLERRIDNRLSDSDRRAEVLLEKTYQTVKLEAERTREAGIKNELETRLYLRDRQDRTEDLMRVYNDRNSDELRDFERRSRDDEGKTRDLLRHIVEEKSERDFIQSALDNQELKTEMAIERALRHRRHFRDDDDFFDDRRDRVRFDPRINVIVEDIDERRPRRHFREECSHGHHNAE